MERKGGMRGLTLQLGTAIRANLQFFATVGRGGGAVTVCTVARAALKIPITVK